MGLLLLSVQSNRNLTKRKVKISMGYLSIVLPAYNEEKMIKKAANIIGGLLQKENINYEILFINDGSKDNTWGEIVACASNDTKVRGVCFSRNFGKESAMFAGLAESKGDCAIVMDCDLQHPPEKIVEMYRLWEQGYEVVEGVKRDRGEESKMHKFAAKCFYRIISNSVNIDMSHASDFKLLDRKAINVLLNMPEKNAFFRALSSWVGFKTTSVEYDVREREVGESKWSTKSLIRYALSNITSFSSAPMQMVTFLGLITLLLSVALGVISFVQKINGSSLEGFTTVIILLGFMGSIIMISLGIIGYYIAKIYDEIKGRPRYIISCEVGMQQNEN